jgi:hypothetical protein
MKITVKSKINKNRCKNLTHLQVFTGHLRCLDVLIPNVAEKNILILVEEKKII